MVYIIILNWENYKDTINCLKSIICIKYIEFKIIVVDNGSRDKSYNFISKYLLKNSKNISYEVLQTGENLGFAGGVNKGISSALSFDDSKYIWVLNNDTEVRENSLLELVKKVDSDKSIGLCGSTLLYLNNPEYIQAIGGRFNYWMATSSQILGHCKFSAQKCQDSEKEHIDFVIGASMFFTKEALKLVGLLSEDYFLYYEEIDWSERLRRTNSGLKIGYAPASIVYHSVGGTIGMHNRRNEESNYSYIFDYYNIVNRLRFINKFYPSRKFIVRLSLIFVVIKRLYGLKFKAAFLAFILFLGAPLSFFPRKL